MRRSSRLPVRFPVGTKYVVESCGPSVCRYIEFPDGRRVQLEARKAQSRPAATSPEISIVPDLDAAEVKPAKPRKHARRAKTEVSAV